MQTILGAGGDIGKLLAKELKVYTDKIRLVARNPHRVNETDQLFKADLTNREDVIKAVKGSEIAYLTVGLTYNIKTWAKDWPVVMQNTIDACLQHNCKLVFFDNVYMYAPNQIPHMTENSELGPVSKKGKIRLRLVEMINEAIKNKGLKVLIARSADFYGPEVKSGLLNILVVDNYKKNKKAFWQSNENKIHSMTFTPDAAKATALLGNTEAAYNQVWHLPTSPEKLTGKELIALTAKAMNREPKYYILSKFLISLIGFFSPVIKELKEMQYQNDRDYFFDSSKFEKTFNIKPTSYEEGIKKTVQKLKYN